MQTMQTLDPATVWEVAKTVIAWLAGIGVVIDLTPGVKFQPVRYLLTRLGNLINADIKKQMDKLESEFKEFKVDSWRTDILDFSNSCMNHRRHTKEEFDHIIETCDKYEKYIEENDLKNGQVDVAHEYILEIYKQCILENDFALEEAEERAKKEAAQAARNARKQR